LIYLGSDYSHLRTFAYTDDHGRSTTAILELGPGEHVYLKGHGNVGVSRRQAVNASNSELVQMLAVSLGLSVTIYRNGRKR
jgi:hypothetical protein